MYFQIYIFFPINPINKNKSRNTKLSRIHIKLTSLELNIILKEYANSSRFTVSL